jgi:hypothetical protein
VTNEGPEKMTKNATGFAAFAHGSVADVKLISMIIVKSIPNVAANPNDPKDYSLSHGVFYDAAEVNKKLSDKLPQEDKRAAVREFVFYKCHNLRLKAVLLEANFCFPADPRAGVRCRFLQKLPIDCFRVVFWN